MAGKPDSDKYQLYFTCVWDTKHLTHHPPSLIDLGLVVVQVKHRKFFGKKEIEKHMNKRCIRYKGNSDKFVGESLNCCNFCQKLNFSQTVLLTFSCLAIQLLVCVLGFSRQ